MRYFCHGCGEEFESDDEYPYCPYCGFESDDFQEVEDEE